ncbi:MAG: hypothetical protein IKG15_10155 [Solobacterium sp.]|nr:hypothetical protein [Solobacterium sp.]
MKKKIIEFTLFMCFVVIFANILEYINIVVIRKGTYQMLGRDDLITSLVVGAVVGYFMFLRDRK